jgi:hypothetical protein
MLMALPVALFRDVNLRHAAGRTLEKWRKEFLAARPPGPMKPGEEILIEMACFGRLYVNHFDAFAVTHAKLFNKKTGRPHPLLAQRDVHAASLRATLNQLHALWRGQTAEESAAAKSPELALDAIAARIQAEPEEIEPQTANAEAQTAADERTEPEAAGCAHGSRES